MPFRQSQVTSESSPQVALKPIAQCVKGSGGAKWTRPTFPFTPEIQKSVIQVTPTKSSLHDIKVNNKIRYSTNCFLTHNLVRMLDDIYFDWKVFRGRAPLLFPIHAIKNKPCKLGCVHMDGRLEHLSSDHFKSPHVCLFFPRRPFLLHEFYKMSDFSIQILRLLRELLLPSLGLWTEAGKRGTGTSRRLQSPNPRSSFLSSFNLHILNIHWLKYEVFRQ